MKFVNLFIFILLMYLSSCKNGEDFKSHPSGLKYRFFIHDDKSTKPKIGDILILKMKYTTEDGKLVFDSKELNSPFRMQLTKPTHAGGSVEDGLSLLNIGDSIQFMVDAISFYEKTKNETLPPNIKQGSKLIFNVKLAGIQSFDELQSERMSKYHESEKEENDLLEHYLKITNVTTKPTASGLYYIETKEGKGKKAEIGKTITVHYTGKFIDGRVFDSSVENHEPFTFNLGKGEVIKGWDEGIALMKEGGKATLIIPSKLGYGDKQRGPIAPYSTLIFEVELLKVN